MGKWRAYGKGCIDVCQRHSEYITKERSKLTEAPKDIQRLEVLKPSDAPDMKTRHAESVSKEAKLQIADEKSEVKTQKISVKKNEAENNSDARSSQTTNNVETGNKWQQLKLKCIVDNSKGDNVLALDEVDAVEEGVNWSDDEGGEKSEDESEEPSN